MKILALEFSSPQRSAAVASGSDVSEVVEAGRAAPGPLSIVDEALRTARLEREQIECIAIGLGPGSYTGIRAAIALAQGWQLARPTRLLGISSVECIAGQARVEGLTGRIQVVVDAQREEFYVATYELEKGGYREIAPLKLASFAEVKGMNEAGEVLVGPETTRWFPEGRTIFPRASVLGTLALQRTDFLDGEKLEPIYLRETSFVKAPPPRVI